MRQILVFVSLATLCACGSELDYPATNDQVWLDGAVFITNQEEGRQLISAQFRRIGETARNVATPMIDLADDGCGYVSWEIPEVFEDPSVTRDIGTRIDLEAPYGTLPLLGTSGSDFTGLVNHTFGPEKWGLTDYEIMEPGDPLRLVIHRNAEIPAQDIHINMGSRMIPLNPPAPVRRTSTVQIERGGQFAVEWIPTQGSDHIYTWFAAHQGPWGSGWTCKLVNDGAAVIDVPAVLNEEYFVMAAVVQELLYADGFEYPLLYWSLSQESWKVTWSEPAY